jgi:hypothetical protein
MIKDLFPLEEMPKTTTVFSMSVLPGNEFISDGCESVTKPQIAKF